MDDLSQVLELNFFAVARVTKAVLPAMRAARTGRVITVTSLNGVVALPFTTHEWLRSALVASPPNQSPT